MNKWERVLIPAKEEKLQTERQLNNRATPHQWILILSEKGHEKAFLILPRDRKKILLDVIAIED